MDELIKTIIDDIINSIEYKCNDCITRAIVEYKVCQVLSNLCCEGKIKDYTVTCDETNNPPSVIEFNNICVHVDWVDIFNKPYWYEKYFN